MDTCFFVLEVLFRWICLPAFIFDKFFFCREVAQPGLAHLNGVRCVVLRTPRGPERKGNRYNCGCAASCFALLADPRGKGTRITAGTRGVGGETLYVVRYRCYTLVFLDERSEERIPLSLGLFFYSLVFIVGRWRSLD